MRHLWAKFLCGAALYFAFLLFLATLWSCAAGPDRPLPTQPDEARLAAFPPPTLGLHYGPLPQQVYNWWPTRPSCADSTRLVVYVHGGGWQDGTPYLAATDPVLRVRGLCLTVASIDYRESPDSVAPAAVRDIKDGLVYFRTLGLPSSKIGLWGYSAGGHLATLVAASCGDAWLGPECADALVSWSGPVGDFTLEDAALVANGCAPRADAPTSPESRWLGVPLQSDSGRTLSARLAPLTYAARPPARFAHGRSDCTVPWQQSAAAAAGWPGAQLSLYLAGHNRQVAPWTADSIVRPVGEFFRSSLR